MRLFSKLKKAPAEPDAVLAAELATKLEKSIAFQVEVQTTAERFALIYGEKYTISQIKSAVAIAFSVAAARCLGYSRTTNY